MAPLLAMLTSQIVSVVHLTTIFIAYKAFGLTFVTCYILYELITLFYFVIAQTVSNMAGERTAKYRQEIQQVSIRDHA